MDALLYLTERELPADCAVVVGAGLNGIARKDGEWARMPALGELTGDLGGGGYIATQAAANRSFDRRSERSALEEAIPRHFGVADVVALARAIDDGVMSRSQLLEVVPLVFEHARTGDSASSRIIRSQAEEVNAVIASLRERLGLVDEVIHTVLGGSVLRYGWDLLGPIVEGQWGSRCSLELPDAVPIIGAARAVLEAAGLRRSLADIRAELDELLQRDATV